MPLSASCIYLSLAFVQGSSLNRVGRLANPGSSRLHYIVNSSSPLLRGFLLNPGVMSSLVPFKKIVEDKPKNELEKLLSVRTLNMLWSALSLSYRESALIGNTSLQKATFFRLIFVRVLSNSTSGV